MKIVLLSDLHYGHKRIPGEHIYKNLKNYVYPELKNCDLCILCGDTFHSLLDFNHPVSKFLILFINDLFYLSQKYKFGIRVLRGTYSHDRNQVTFIEQCAHKYMTELNIDIKTYSNISLDEETINNESISILYLPDDLPYKNVDDCLDYVYELFNTRKIKSVDMIIGHGYCQHVLPCDSNMTSSLIYTEEKLNKICNHCAYFGHVHTPSIHKNKNNFSIIYVGSFERMNHGEEEKKGFLIVDTSTWKNTFIENKNTLKFLTYTPLEDDTLKIIENFKKWINSQNLSKINQNYIRVIHNKPEIRQLLGKIIKDEFPEYKCIYSTKSTAHDLSISDTKIDLSEINLIKPTEENIVDLIYDFLKDNNIGELDKLKIQDIWSLKYGEE